LYRRCAKAYGAYWKPRRAGRSWHENAKFLSKSAASSIKLAGLQAGFYHVEIR
jgi:hypothetical protein